ncbi:MAG: hypothetical protein QM719_06115 [Thermomonas sp.]
MDRKTLLAAALLPILAACKPAAAPQAGPTPAPAAPTAAVAAAPGPVSDARADVVAAMRAFWNLRSYHTAMHIEGGPRGPIDNAVDFVAPDRYRMETAGRGAQVIIGDTMYMDVNGHGMKVPLPEGTLTQWRDPGKLADAETEMTVEAQGSDAVDGQAAKKYLVRVAKPKPGEMTMWIGDNGLPLQIVSHNPMGQATIRYSRFNDPALSIEAPQ